MNTPRAAAPPNRPVQITSAVTPDLVDALALSPGLGSIVRNPALHRRILGRLTVNPRARLTLAVDGDTLAGYAVIAPSFGRWQTLPGVREFGIEVAREWRHTGVARQLTLAALADPVVEEEILLAFTLPRAWDAGHEGLSIVAYGQWLEESASRYGFRKVSTDEPEVQFERGAALLVRIGRHVPEAAIAAFDRVRYLRHAGQPASHAA